MFLIDTMVLSETRKLGSSRIDPVFEAWALAADTQVQFVSVITIAELEFGIERLYRDHTQSAALRHWLASTVLPKYRPRLLPIDESVAIMAGRLQAQQTRSRGDLFLAATALVHGLTLVTRNLRDFDGTGVRLLDPWQPG